MNTTESNDLAQAMNAYNARVQEGVDGAIWAVVRWVLAGLVGVAAFFTHLLPMFEGWQ